MALMIIEGCTLCDACVEVCPNDAIAEGDELYVIDAFKCTECVGAEDEPQCELVCAPDCIEANPEFEESPEELQEKYEQLH
ncbi:MAG: YfhL family 4Fe-4S dicluster ferredoxin [Proteobacteria bacterium]|nr:YfhL family 4Fe-4S dicluster ferredoxin [Pseudomonadota bacterium]